MKYLLAVSFLWPVLMVVGGLGVYTVFRLAGLLMQLLVLVVWTG